MAGTIVADTIQDGAGNSTSMDNAIYGSAKAWVNFNGSGGAIRASYNVSSITVNGTGDYTVNFTNAFSDTNYVAVVAGGTGTSNNAFNSNTPSAAPTTSTFRFQIFDYAMIVANWPYNYFAFYR